MGGLQLELVWVPTGSGAPFTFRDWNSFQESIGSGLGLAQAWIFPFPMVRNPKLTQAPDQVPCDPERAGLLC